MPPYKIDPFETQDLERRFTYHPATGDQPDRYQAIRSSALALAKLISASCPPGRERSLAITNLEQAVMWANAGIAREIN